MEKAVVSLVHRKEVPESPGKYSAKGLKVVHSMVKEAIELVGGIESVVKPNDRVVVKANACWPVPADTGIPDDPRVVEALIRIIKEETEAREIVLVERCGVGGKTKDALEVTGIKAAAERGGVDRIMALDEDSRVRIKISKAKALIDEVYLPKIFLDADVLIYLSKMKTHKQTGITLSMKLSQGALVFSDGIRCHRADLEQKFVDLLRVIKPNLSIIDGIWAVQGQGPGVPYKEDLIKDMNVIVAGRDPVAVDSVGAAIMGFDPLHDIGMIRGATVEGLGEGDLHKIQVRGSKIEEVRRFFKRGSISLVGLHPKIDAYIGGACPGCCNFTRTGIDPVLADPAQLENVERITFIIGYDTNVPDKVVHMPPTHYVFVVGDCTAEHKDRGIFLPGCASTSVHGVPFIGKSDEEIKQIYHSRYPVGYVP